MRGSLANHLSDFIEQVNIAIDDAKKSGVIPTPELARERLAGLAAFNTTSPEIDFSDDRVLDAGSHKILVKVYSPDKETPLDVLIFFHGAWSDVSAATCTSCLSVTAREPGRRQVPLRL